MTNKLTPGASTGRATKLPTIPVVRTGNPEMDRFVLAVKEYVEVRDGVRGNPYDRFATMRDVDASIETAKDASNTDGLLLSSGAQTGATSTTAITAETAKIRTELARTERNLRDTIAQLAATVNDNALTSQAVQSLSGVNRYTQADLSSDLASGAATIIAGATSGNAVMELAPDGSYVLFKHRLANIGGLGAGYSGTVRTAVGITAAGFLAGFNRRSDGVFQPSVVIDSATGDVTILGTLKANSVIEVGAFLGSQTVSSVLSDVSTASSNASSALAQVANKLNKNATDILSGTISFTSAGGFRTDSISIDGSGNATGTGVAITSKGIVGRNSGGTTFTIDATTGAATFAGDITSSGRFVLSGAGYIYGGGPAEKAVAYIDGSAAGYGLYIKGGTSFTAALEVDAIGASSIAIVGSGAGSGTGIFGSNSSTGIGVYGFQTGSAAAVRGWNSSTGPSVECVNRFRWGSYTYTAPDGGTDKYLRNDGQWALVSGITSGVSSFNTRTGAVTLSTSDLTGTAPGSSFYLSGGGWSSTSPIMTSAFGNSGVAVASGSSINFFGSTSTGIAGAYVGTSGSGNTVTFTVQSTSPSDVRLKEEIQDADIGLDFVNSLRPVSYKLKADPKHQKGYGFIADEVEGLIGLGSSLVYHEPDWKVGDVQGFKTIHYPSYIAILTKAIQELSARVAQLEQTNVS